MTVKPTQIRSQFPKISLRSVLIVPFVVQIVLAVGLVSYLSYRSAQKSVEDVAKQLLNEKSIRIEQNIQNYFNLPKQITQTNSSLISQGILNWQDLPVLQKHFAQQLQIFPTVNDVAIANENKDFLGVSRHTTDSLIVRILDTSQGQKYERYVANLAGQIGQLQQTPINIPPNDLSDEQLYKTSRDSKQGVWQLTVSGQNGANKPIPIAAYNLPFYDQTGKLQGVLSSSVSLTKIDDILKDINVGYTGQAFLIDRKGVLIAKSTSEVSDSELSSRRLQAITNQELLPLLTAKYLGDRVGNLEQITASQNLIFERNGQRFFVEILPLKIDQNAQPLDCLTVIVVPESDFVSEIRANTDWTFLFCGLAAVIAIAIGNLIAHCISEPIVSINKAAKQISNIYFVTPTTNTPVRELGKLNNSFTEMSQHLQVSFESLVNQKLYLANLLETLPIGVAIHGADGSLTYLNESAKRLLETEPIPEVPVNKLTSAYQIYVAGTDQLYPSQLLPSVQAIQGKSCCLDDLEIARGELRISLEARATPLLSLEGEVNGAIVIFKDITDRKTAEKILSNYNRKLEEDVRQRTLDLQQEIQERHQIEVTLRQIESELTKVNQELKKQINIDGLTQIANRRCFDAHLDQEWRRLSREKQPLSLLIFDVDYFKRYNDQYGHQLGDECLIQIAGAVAKVMRRSTDLLARYGGEEFVVILPNTDLEGAFMVAKLIHEAIADLRIPHQTSKVNDMVTVSLGISSQFPDAERSPYLLITQADQALYLAKEQGRNRSISFAE